jgi:NADPH:quinone reductase-like Zn-dependent oxidoreductase
MSAHPTDTTSGAAHSLPATHKALRQDVYGEPPSVQTIARPQATSGSAVVRVHFASVLNYTKNIYNGQRKYPYPTPLTLGLGGVGRVAELGVDATILEVGDLVLLDITIRGRDDVGSTHNNVFLSAISEGATDGSRTLMRDAWRDGSYAEYVKVPLENCHRVDETRLSDLNYQIRDLQFIPKLMVPYGGLGPGGVGVKPGETVVVSPATGGFGSAAVHVCLALGAGRVVAMGRNRQILERLESDRSGRVTSVPLSGDWKVDLAAVRQAAGGLADVFFDTSPPEGWQNSGHVKAGILSLRRGGRCCLMSGGGADDLGVPLRHIVHSNITVQGKWMYDPVDVQSMIRMVETGVLRLNNDAQGDAANPFGSKCRGTYRLEDWEQAFDEAERIGSDGFVVMEP